MCVKCDPTTAYSTAYQMSKSASIRVETTCPKCRHRIEYATEVHEGGEYAEHFVRCSNCTGRLLVKIGPVKINRAVRR